MGYPTAWRAGRGLQGAGRALPLPASGMPNPFQFGAAAGLAYAAWAFGDLLSQIDMERFLPGPVVHYIQKPGSYGWTLTEDCGQLPQRLPAAAWLLGSCGLKVVAKGAWENAPSQNPLTASTLYWWANYGNRYNATLIRYENCATAQRWDKGLGLPFAVSTITWAWPKAVPNRLVKAAPNTITRAYDPADRDSRWTSISIPWEPSIPDTDAPVIPVVVVNPGARTVSWEQSRAIPRVRAIAAATTRELKIPRGSRAGRAFMAMYRAFNFLGDAYGFARALHSAIPRGMRGSSRKLGAMAGDLWDYFGFLGTYAPRDERLDYFFNAAIGASKWKMQDAAFGGLQAGIFSAQAERYGYHAARAWSTIDSSIQGSEGGLRRAYDRSQGNARW